MHTRLRHRIALTTDRDVLQVGMVTLGALCATAGMLYFAYFAHVVRVARRAPTLAVEADKVLLFGKHSPNGVLDADFEARIARAVELHSARSLAEKPVHWVFLGGAEPGQISEAEIAFTQMTTRGIEIGDRYQLESSSRDTLQNLRNARDLMRESMGQKVALLTSRYHLARCQIYAKQLGFESELCAAEPRLRLNLRNLVRLAGEAGYVMLSDIGARWAKLSGNRRMLGRVT